MQAAKLGKETCLKAQRILKPGIFNIPTETLTNNGSPILNNLLFPYTHTHALLSYIPRRKTIGVVAVTGKTLNYLTLSSLESDFGFFRHKMPAKDDGSDKEKCLELFLKIGLDERTAKNTVANNKVTANLTSVINEVYS